MGHRPQIISNRNAVAAIRVRPSRTTFPTTALRLMIVENGTEFTQQVGDINEAYYNSLESALNELASLLRGEGRELYLQFRERLARVEQLASHIGWGYGDCVREQVAMLEDELAGP